MALASRMIAHQSEFQSHRQPGLAVSVDHELTILGPFVDHDVLDEQVDFMGEVDLVAHFVAQRPHKGLYLLRIWPRLEARSPLTGPKYSSGVSITTFIIGSNSAILALVQPSLNAKAPACSNATWLESTS